MDSRSSSNGPPTPPRRPFGTPGAEPVVRLVASDDIGGLSRMLARAFWDDPVSSHLFPSERSRPRRLERYFRFQLRSIFLPRGEGYTTEDLAAAALWMPPRDHRPPSIADALAQLPAVFILGRSLSRAVGLVQLLEPSHPKAPHYYLATIGTEPSLRGRGIASAVLRPVLARCDAEGIPAYLESSKEGNVAFYERHGFKVTGKVTVPGTAVRLWLMWRQPQRG
ncbi:MAG: GNAT family N-acetyltransferase [Actinomycetota bacterium]|nr:GNAT family N-acetyltransferase [Actinomycetota bacterium]